MRGGKFLSVNNFSVQEHASSKKQATNVFVEKYILIQMFAWSVQIVSGLESQSNFQIFTKGQNSLSWGKLAWKEDLRFFSNTNRPGEKIKLDSLRMELP